MNHRASDGPVQSRFWAFLNKADAVFSKITPLISLTVATLSVAVAAFAVYNIEQEGKERRDQNCILFERQAQANAQRVIGTYDYLRTLAPEDYGTNLTKTIIRNLPTTEAEARATVAPAYCQKPGIGLPELGTDPKIPLHQDFSDRARPHP